VLNLRCDAGWFADECMKLLHVIGAKVRLVFLGAITDRLEDAFSSVVRTRANRRVVDRNAMVC
jgi:hypothetical protein